MASLLLPANALPTALAWPACRADMRNRRPYLKLASRTHFVILLDNAAVTTPASPVAAVARTIESEPEERASFTELDAIAVQIGRHDPLPFLDPGGRLARIACLLFGSKPPNPLADPRLEALRVVVIAMRRRGGAPKSAIDAALAAGITRTQLDHLASELCPLRPL